MIPPATMNSGMIWTNIKPLNTSTKTESHKKGTSSSPSDVLPSDNEMEVLYVFVFAENIKNNSEFLSALPHIQI